MRGTQHPASLDPSPPRERMLLLVLAAIQFTTILDFLIIMPLGPQYMRVFSITAAQFGVIISAYALSAGVSGIAAGFILDRFDRKPALLALYLGFTVGTLFCAIAPTYPTLVAARNVAGAFGGVANALILAIIGDVVPERRRGRAMGVVMSSFSVASICGVPTGLILASRMSWHVPFYVLTALSALVLVAAALVLPSIRGHLDRVQEQHPAARMLTIMFLPDHRLALLFMACLTVMGFIVFPYISSYMVANVGLTEHQLPLIYLAGGLFTLVTTNWVGRWADRAGKHRVFTFATLAAIVPIVILTNLPASPLPLALTVTTVFMICMSGRMVPAMALLTASIEGRYRAGFMSVNSAVQQFSAGLAAFVSGHIITQPPGGRMTHFPVIGVLSIACALACVYLARFLHPPAGAALSAEPVALEASA